MANHFLGIDIGGTQIKWVLMDEGNVIISQDTSETQDTFDEIAVWKDKIIALVQSKLQESEGNGHTLKCGISAPGLADSTNQMILHMPKRLKGIEQFNWSKACGIKISVLNDGHAAALAEYKAFYRESGIKQFLMLTLGTGVGGGIVMNGKLYQGHHQRAGHLGHTTVNVDGPQTMTNMPGSLEYAIGNFSVKERTNGQYETTKQLVTAYLQKSKDAICYWEESVKKLAIALAGFNNLLAPEVIVLGGGIAAGAKDALLSPLKKYLNQFEWRPGGHKVDIQLARLGAYAGAQGAALFAKNQIEL